MNHYSTSLTKLTLLLPTSNSYIQTHSAQMDLEMGDSNSWPGFLSPKQKGKKCTPPSGCDLSGMSFRHNNKTGVMTHVHVHTLNWSFKHFLSSSRDCGDLAVQLRFWCDRKKRSAHTFRTSFLELSEELKGSEALPGC